MNLQEIKDAVLAGHTVHWSSDAYEIRHNVFPSGREQWLICCDGTGGSIGLSDTDDNLNCDPDKFYIGPGKEIVLQSQHGYIHANALTGAVVRVTLSDEWRRNTRRESISKNGSADIPERISPGYTTSSTSDTGIRRTGC